MLGLGEAVLYCSLEAADAATRVSRAVPDEIRERRADADDIVGEVQELAATRVARDKAQFRVEQTDPLIEVVQNVGE